MERIQLWKNRVSTAWLIDGVWLARRDHWDNLFTISAFESELIAAGLLNDAHVQMPKRTIPFGKFQEWASGCFIYSERNERDTGDNKVYIWKGDPPPSMYSNDVREKLGLPLHDEIQQVEEPKPAKVHTDHGALFASMVGQSDKE